MPILFDGGSALDNRCVLGSKILAGRIWSADAAGEAAPLRAGTVAQRQVLLTSVSDSDSLNPDPDPGCY